jgi:hypothetical protein
MAKRLYHFKDPIFDEWFFDYLSNITSEQKQLLNNHELGLIRNRKQLLDFVNTGNLEKKLTLLTKVGIEWHTLFYIPERFDFETLKKVYSQYQMKGKRLEEIINVVKSGAFVLSSKDVAVSLAMMNQNVHTDEYILNKKYLRVTPAYENLLANISKTVLDHTLVTQHKAVLEAQQYLASIFLETMLSDTFTEADLNLTPLDLCILCLLYNNPNSYYKMDYIRRTLKTKYKPGAIGVRCAYLWKERKMIDKLPTREREPSYKIMQNGIMAVGSLLNRIVNMAENR